MIENLINSICEYLAVESQAKLYVAQTQRIDTIVTPVAIMLFLIFLFVMTVILIEKYLR